MKKIVVVLGLCALLLAMPTLCAFPTMPKIQLPTPTLDEYDGTFVGGLGRLYKEGGEWQFDTWAYLAGVYKLGAYKRLYGGIYNLNQEQIGTIGAYFGHKIIIGYLETMQGHRAPMIGFLMWNNQNFAGRIMTTFGPAPHIIGEYTPNT
ncbi:MAG: hypothetical protein JXA00_06135 [Candidatus Thermoplasmatota archaeon]|nr:hypothetical protein [Candidatus Thermoplasmatota archaeon]